MIGDNNSDTALLVGGTRDGERAKHKNYHEILMPKIPSPRAVAENDSLEAEIEKYVRFNPIFVDKDYNEHQYLVYRHEDISEAQAFKMIIEGYSKKEDK